MNGQKIAIPVGISPEQRRIKELEKIITEQKSRILRLENQISMFIPLKEKP